MHPVAFNSQLFTLRGVWDYQGVAATAGFSDPGDSAYGDVYPQCGPVSFRGQLHSGDSGEGAMAGSLSSLLLHPRTNL